MKPELWAGPQFPPREVLKALCVKIESLSILEGCAGKTGLGVLTILESNTDLRMKAGAEGWASIRKQGRRT